MSLIAIVLATAPMTTLALASENVVEPGRVPAHAPFHEVLGVREFSDRLVARPVQTSTWQERGLELDDAARRTRDARSRLDPWRVRLHQEVDEHILLVPDAMTESQLATALLSTGDYDYVEPDWLVHAVAIPDDPSFSLQWHLPQISAPSGWDLFTGDEAIVIAVCDSGIDLDHPDLVDRLVPGYNVVDDLAQIDGGAVDGLTNHGTEVAGAAAATGDNAIGISGVGWNLSLMPIRVSNLPNDMALLSDLNDGARWAVDHGAHVINVSFSGVQSLTVQTTGEYVREHGGNYVWAAGNAGVPLQFDHDAVFIVGATDQSDALAEFSNFGSALDVVAPGVDIYMTQLGGGYGANDGTSFASPITAGVLAMIRAANPNFTPADAEAVLIQTVDDLGETGDDAMFGHGRVNLEAAVALALEVAKTPFPPFAVNDVGFSFGGEAALIDVLANDSDLNGDPLHIDAFDATSTAGGSVILIPGDRDTNDQLQYTPPSRFEGIDSFSYTVADPTRLTDIGVVTIAVGQPPELGDAQTFIISPGISNFYRNLAAGDFDGDGLIDVVASDTSGSTPQVLLFAVNDGTGGFEPQPAVTVGPPFFVGGEMAALDADGDDVDDLILLEGGFLPGDQIVIVRNGPDVLAQSSKTIAMPDARELHAQTGSGDVIDVNNDLHPDFALLANSSPVEHQLIVGVNDSRGGYKFIPIATDSIMEGLVVEDIDADGDQDVVYHRTTFIFGTPTLNTLHVLLNDGAGNFAPAQVIEVNFFIDDLLASDYDEDGDLDLMSLGRASGAGFDTSGLWAIEQLDDHTFDTDIEFLATIGGAGATQVKRFNAIDFEPDGLDDYLVSYFGTTTDAGHEAVLNVDAGFVLPVTFPIPVTGIPSPIEGISSFNWDTALFDVDDDGDRDLIVLTETAGIGAVLELRTIDSSPVTPSGDLDDDGDVDFTDLLLLLDAWGECEGECSENLDDSGDVGFADLLILLANWG